MPQLENDGLDYWRAKLAGQSPKMAPDEIHQGYYRIRRKGQPSEAVRFMIEDDYWVALRNDVPQPSDKIGHLFQWACQHPITEAVYWDFINGKGWPDEPAARIGHNLPDEADPLDKITVEFEGEREQADEMLAKPVTTQDEADRLAIWADRIQDINKAVKAEHAVEKRPALDEGKRIDQRWRPLMDTTEAYYKKLKAHVKPWMVELDRLEFERQLTARRNAEMLREKAREMSEAAMKEGPTSEAMKEAGAVVAEAQAAERETVFRNPQAGRTGAKVAMRTIVSARIVDYEVALAAVKNEQEIKDAVQRIANAIAKVKGVPTLAGTERIERREPV